MGAIAPLLPLLGPLDRAAGLRLEVTAGSRSDVSLAIRRCFAPPARLGATGGEVLHAEVLGDLRARAALLERLHSAIVKRGSRLEATPAARRVVDEERERASRRARCAAHAPRAARELGTLERKLYPYQREGVARLLEQGRLLLADDMGLGEQEELAGSNGQGEDRTRFYAKFVEEASSSDERRPMWLIQLLVETVARRAGQLVSGEPHRRLPTFATSHRHAPTLPISNPAVDPPPRPFFNGLLASSNCFVPRRRGTSR